MGVLSSDLKNLGYEPTDKESPFDDDGQLWTKGYELVCDQTGVVIRKDGDNSFQGERQESEEETVYRYHNSQKVRMPGGYVGSYSWGKTERGFDY